MNLLQKIFNKIIPKKHIWKETGRENLGHFTDFGHHLNEITTLYRIAIHEVCLLTGEKRIREIYGLSPVGNNQNEITKI